MSEKVCSKCGDSKDLSEFNRNRNKRDRRGAYCKVCSSEYYKEYMISPRGMALRMVRDAKRRSKRDKIPFSLNSLDLIDRLETGICELSGLPFVLGSNEQSPYSPSIDRIVPAMGYAPDNIRIICWSLNAAFGSWGEDETRKIMTTWLQHA